MNNEEFQNIVLNKLSNIDKKFGNLESDIKDLKTDVSGLKIDVKGLNQKIDSLESRVGVIENQTKENAQILHALKHSAEVNKAEQDKMMIGISHIEGDATAIRKDLALVETITANNYSDIVKLKAIR